MTANRNDLRNCQYNFLLASALRNEGERERKLNKLIKTAMIMKYRSLEQMWMRTFNIKFKERDYVSMDYAPGVVHIYYGGYVKRGFVHQYGHLCIGIKNDDVGILFHRRPFSPQSRNKKHKLRR